MLTLPSPKWIAFVLLLASVATFAPAQDYLSDILKARGEKAQ
jgi:hypothetical protein